MSYDGRVVYQTYYMKSARLFLSMIYLQNHKIVRDSVRVLAYDISKRNLSTLYVAIVRRSYD